MKSKSAIRIPVLKLILYFGFILSFNSNLACTIFNKSDDNAVLFGNVENENPSFVSELHFVRANETLGKYGSFFIKGQNGYIGGGMNDQGLCFDVAAYPDPQAFNGKPHGDLMKYLLEDCATVQDALSFFNQYYWPGHCCNHIMIMDKTGSSAVVELIYGVLYIHLKDGESQTITNYSITEPEIRYGDYPCPRYEKVTAQLDTAAITIDNFQKICEGVHNAYYNALFATIYNPNSLDIYFFNPNISGSKRTHFNLTEELKKDSHFYKVKNCQIISDILEKRFYPYSISANYPNPFSANTSFSISISRTAQIDISVQDLHGKQLVVIADQKYSPGEHTFSWGSEHQSPGLYLCRFNIDGIIETRKWIKR